MRETAWIVASLVVLGEVAVSQMQVVVGLSDNLALMVDCDRTLR